MSKDPTPTGAPPPSEGAPGGPVSQPPSHLPPPPPARIGARPVPSTAPKRAVPVVKKRVEPVAPSRPVEPASKAAVESRPRPPFAPSGPALAPPARRPKSTTSSPVIVAPLPASKPDPKATPIGAPAAPPSSKSAALVPPSAPSSGRAVEPVEPVVAAEDASNARRPSAMMRAPTPSPEGFMSTAAMKSLADIALALRDEQLEAKVVLYKSELRTSPELDAITDKVVQELQELQAQARAAAQASPTSAEERARFEIELIQSLKEMLARTFRPGKMATVIERKLAEVTKRFVRVFFQSELATKIRGAEGEMKVMRFPEQALFHALRRCESAVFDTIDAFQYLDDDVRVAAQEGLHAMMKELRSAYLQQTTPELDALVGWLNDVLGAFFTQELPPMLGELAWEVVKEARLADRPGSASYKISATVFPTFRQAFEKNFLERLVVFTEQQMLERVRGSEAEFRSETIRFVADPKIFSDVCEVVCDAIYDMLYNDGFLDLPSDWRARLSSAG